MSKPKAVPAARKTPRKALKPAKPIRVGKSLDAASRSGTGKKKTPAKAAATAKPLRALESSVPAASKKPKLVRDSFAIPKNEYQALGQLKERALALDRPTRKSEVLRAGIAALARLGDLDFIAALNSVPTIKTGRPKDSRGASRK